MLCSPINVCKVSASLHIGTSTNVCDFVFINPAHKLIFCLLLIFEKLKWMTLHNSFCFWTTHPYILFAKQKSMNKVFTHFIFPTAIPFYVQVIFLTLFFYFFLLPFCRCLFITTPQCIWDFMKHVGVWVHIYTFRHNSFCHAPPHRTISHKPMDVCQIVITVHIITKPTHMWFSFRPSRAINFCSTPNTIPT